MPEAGSWEFSPREIARGDYSKWLEKSTRFAYLYSLQDKVDREALDIQSDRPDRYVDTVGV